MKSFQELADEAFGDLLRKHDRPVDLKDALRRSTQRIGANDNPGQSRASGPRRGPENPRGAGRRKAKS